MLTTDDLISTTFTTTRMREGYEASEVDEFLSATRETLRHRDAEIRDLRDRVETGRSTSGDGAVGVSTADRSRAAARLLEIAATNADQLVGEARAEAASMVATAHADADQLTAAAHDEATQQTTYARTEADRVLAEARQAAERVTAELEGSRNEQTAELERQRTTALSEMVERQTALEGEISRLQQVEQDCRERMRTFLTSQLAQIDPTQAD